jgi:predicted lipid-binding transport protein (Tim44 family)
MKSKIAAYLLSAFLILFIAFDAYSRAGGAGGSHGGGSHGGGGFGSGDGGGGGGGALVWFFLMPWPVKILIVLGIIAAVIYSYYKKRNSGGTDLESGSSQGPSGTPKGIPADFVAANPNFNEQAFIGKVSTAFTSIQEAWQNKNLSKVRKWISDGVYQRFNVQFMMMNLLEQTNYISNINIKQIRIEEAIQEGAYSIITASVYFSDDDNFICKKDPSFDEKFSGDTATEYWTFIKKSGVAEKDLYHSNNCPKCGYELGNDGGQVSKCPSCGTVTYLGDYDWVLCEITQEEDYERGGYRIEKTDPSLQALYTSDKEFSIQMMEDKASNAIMQYFASRTSHDLKYIQRFTSPDLFAQLETQIKGEGKFIYNRIFLNAVDTISCTLVNGVYNIGFNIFYSSMRMQANEKGGLSKIDDTVIERSIVLTLAKKAGAVQKTQLWSFACPSCGAPYTDTTATNCTYCQAQLNSTDNDWVMMQISEQ